MLARISNKGWLLNTLRRGQVRFAPASSYRDPTLNTARADDEMSKTYRRPGAALQILGPGGDSIQPIGDVSFSSRRAIEREGHLHETPYWFCSFSSDLDPRLFAEFPGDDPADDACLVIFEPDIFARRALPRLNQSAPRAVKSLFPTDYFDPNFPPPSKLSAMASKEMSYAFQREMRFVLDPEGGAPLTEGGAFFVEIGSIADIAGVYGPDGGKIAGAGPASFLA
ncbi:hypothetical protein D3869_16990 (plasmid) [Azospirillum brasilense]|uniref:Uncharacterized protein n=2 Tax=Azospirillum brasilense TaxID=192 RepID=A0A4D8R8E9_AZOBR|nr:hypothetical protein D3869_16990 [Azospirillum brasilense]